MTSRSGEKPNVSVAEALLDPGGQGGLQLALLVEDPGLLLAKSGPELVQVGDHQQLVRHPFDHLQTTLGQLGCGLWSVKTAGRFI